MKQVIADLKVAWAAPRRTIQVGKEASFELVCRFQGPATETELKVAPKRTPKDIFGFWREARQADLFLDVEYGQWGLRIFSPTDVESQTAEARTKRQLDIRPDDLVIARFIGDLELLVVRCDPKSADFGHVIVCLPMDPRDKWPVAASSFSEFLKVYAQNSGEKYWDRSGSGRIQ